VFAGVERYIASVSAELAARGHHVTVIGGDERSMRQALNGAQVMLFPSQRTTRNVALELVRRSRSADILHVHMTAAEAAALLSRPLIRVPVIATRHFAAERGATLPGRVAAPLIRQMLATELAISQYVAQSTRDPMLVVLNGVANQDAIDPAHRVVLLSQRLEPEKKTADALEAWQAAGLAAEGWELWITGDGSERAALEERVVRMGISGVSFRGHVHNLDELRSSAGIALATAAAEPFGLTAAECMARGLPVVAAGAGGHLETVGAAAPDLLYPPGDIVTCARLLQQLAFSLDRRRRVGAVLRAFQQSHLSLTTHVDRLEEVYRQQLQSTPRQRSRSEAMRPCLVFPGATRRGGVERAVWEGLRYLGSRHPTTFVGNVVDTSELPTITHVIPGMPLWGRGPLAPIAFRISAGKQLPFDPGTVSISFGTNSPPGDVFVVNSLHRSWLRVAHGARFAGIQIPKLVRYLMPRHLVLLALEWTYFRLNSPLAVIAVSDAVARELTSLYHVPPEIVTVIPNGYDPAQCNRERRGALRAGRRASFGISDDAVVLLFVANELHRKGLGTLLEAVARLPTEPFEIHVVGRTPLDDYVGQIKNLGLESRVRYHGSTGDIGLFHAIADVLVLPTQYEAFSLAIVEALASGLPVITTTVPGAADLIEPGFNGLLQHNPSQPAELAELLEQALSAENRDRWGQGAIESVAGLDWHALMERYERVLGGVC
jgi:glycosyltransferase involved in cell wall biosynthesis